MMKRPNFLAVVLAIAFSFSGTAAPAAESDAQVAARQVALELAGAFSNAGFKIRDGHWSTDISTGDSKLIEVNLYAGNQYWFSVGATDGARKLRVTVFDENGRELETEHYSDGARAAAGFEPTVSGPYFIEVEQIEGGPATFCLLYSYQ